MENKKLTAVEILLNELDYSLSQVKRTNLDQLHIMMSIDEAIINEKKQIVEAMMHCGSTKEEAENYYREKFTN